MSSTLAERPGRSRSSARPSAPPPSVKPLLNYEPEASATKNENTTTPEPRVEHAEPKKMEQRSVMKIHPDLMNKEIPKRVKNLDLNAIATPPVARQRGTGFRGRPEWIKAEPEAPLSDRSSRRIERMSPQHERSPSPIRKRGRVKDTLTFYSFIRGISVMTRGSPTEKAQRMTTQCGYYERL